VKKCLEPSTGLWKCTRLIVILRILAERKDLKPAGIRQNRSVPGFGNDAVPGPLLHDFGAWAQMKVKSVVEDNLRANSSISCGSIALTLASVPTA
jgi:hypothetical protein